MVYVNLWYSSNVTYVNVPIQLTVAVDIGFEPTPWDVNYSYNEVVIETYKGGSLYSRKTYSFPLQLYKSYYEWTVNWSAPEPNVYIVRAGWRLVYLALPYGYPEYVWSKPITVAVQSPTAPPTVPPPTPPTAPPTAPAVPEWVKYLALGVAGALGVAVVVSAVRRRR